MSLNEIGLCSLSLSKSVVFDSYQSNRATGSFIIIDRLTNVTVGAGMIKGAAESGKEHPVTPEERAARLGQKALVMQLPGLSAGQLNLLERKLFDRGFSAVCLEQADAEKELFLTSLGFVVLTRESASCPAHSFSDCDNDPVDTVCQLISP